MEKNPLIIFRAIQQQNNPIKFFLAKILIRLNISKFFTIDRIFYKLKFFPSAYSRALWIDPNFRINEENFFRDYLKSKDVVIDIGANIGTITLTCAAAVGKFGKVFSFEAHPKIFDFLSKNIQLNEQKNIEQYNLALSDKSGCIFFSDVISDGQNKVLQNNSGIKVTTKTLDSFEYFQNRISLLKIDVEGYELFVFKGGEKTLEKTDCIYFEVVERLYQNYNYSSKDVFDFLFKNNFEIFSLESKKIKKITNNFQLCESQNLLAIKNLNDFLKRTNYQIA